MYLFYVTEPLRLEAVPAAGGRRGLSHRPAAPGVEGDGAGRLDLRPPEGGTLTAETLYLGFSLRFLDELSAQAGGAGGPAPVRTLAAAAQARVLSLSGLPPRFGHGAPGGDAPEAQLAAAGVVRPERVAVVNLFGLAFGDAVVFLTALRELRRRLEAYAGGPVAIDLLQHPDNLDVEALYLGSGVVDAVRHLPVPLAVLAGYDAYADLTAPYGSHGLPWTDEMLELLAIEPESVPASRKRNALPRPGALPEEDEARVAALRARGAPVVLFHHRASTAVRSIPDAAAARLVEELLGHGDWIVATSHPLAAAHPRFVDWSGIATSFDRLAALVSRVDAVLCVDTCVFHLADAFGVPGVALFTSIEPRLRTAYYPGIRSLLLGGAGNRILGRVNSVAPDDVSYAHELWNDLDAREVTTLLAAALSAPSGSPLPPDRTA
jgi:hypothetical protein